jgi:hypothetical protein
MNNTERLIRLNAWKEMKDLEERTKEQLRIEHEAKLKNDIEALWDRAKALIDLYNASIDAGLMYFPSDWSSYSWHRDDQNFISDGISHRLGFGKYQPNNYKVDGPRGLSNREHADAISIRGGGACRYELDLHNHVLHYTGTGAIKEMETFVEDFNRFEKRFYDYFDKKTGGNR